MGEGGRIGKFFERFSSLLSYGSTFQSMSFKIGLLCLAPLLCDLTVKQENLFNITIYWTEIHASHLVSSSEHVTERGYRVLFAF